MSPRRLLLWLRLLVGAGFMYQGVAHIYAMREMADLFAANPAWQAWPFVGSYRPLELTLWIAFLEFGMGVFLFGGLLTRILGGLGTLLAAFQLLALGLAGGPLNVLLLAASLTVFVKGGGGGTMDSALGAMQRRSIERQRERDAEAARLKAERKAAKAQAETAAER
jgi:signal transduction histidine kinase